MQKQCCVVSLVVPKTHKTLFINRLKPENYEQRQMEIHCTVSSFSAHSHSNHAGNGVVQISKKHA